jgi:hypothetical protein
LGLALLACRGESSNLPADASPRERELAEAEDSYAAMCAMCPKSELCCLSSADFAPERWSAAAGDYLRALRDHSDCVRANVQIDQSLYAEDPLVPAPMQTTYRHVCQVQACIATRQRMAAELDAALPKAVAHAAGAILICPS